MIELPRAALSADQIATHADFFSFGTNDLTQTTLGLSRDDAEGKFLAAYVEDGILARQPVRRPSTSTASAGWCASAASTAARATRPEDRHLRRARRRPGSVDFFHRAGLDYVSCSPFRVPVARLAAAQAVIQAGAPDR